MNKELKSTIKYLKKNRILAIKTIIPVVIFCLVVTIIGILFPKPNDNITPSNRGYLFENRNPKFNVGFGIQEEPYLSYVRFEAKVDNVNPFEKKDVRIWDGITQVFSKKQGFEFGLSEVRFGDTNSDTSKNLKDTIGDAIEDMEIDNILTDTEVIDVGRVLGEKDSNDVSKKTVINKDVYPGIDLEYQILENLGVKEEIIIRNIDEYTANCSGNTECLLPLNEFVFDLKLDEGVQLKESMAPLRGQSETKYYITDSKGNYIAHFLPTFAVDAVGSKTTEVDLDISNVEGNSYEVVVTLESDWLFSNDRVFPIRIDPSIVHDTTTEFDTGSDYNTEVVTGPKVQLESPEIDYIDSNVVGYWKLDESGGTGAYIEDSSTNGNDGTPTGTTYAEDGVLGGARSFNGSSDQISTAASGPFTGNFTIEAWVKFDSVNKGGDNALLGHGTASAGNGLHVGERDGKAYFGFYGDDMSGSQTLFPGVWYHLAFVYDGTKNIYINGKLDMSGSSGTYGSTATNVMIGKYPFSTNHYMFGLIDEVRVSNTARSADEIERLYEVGYEAKTQGVHTSASLDMGASSDVESITWSPVGTDTGDGETPYSTTGLVAQWNFNESSGTTATSGGSCGTTCNGTLTGYSNTTGQDVVAGSGWTSDNRRWGSGAVMFDGTDDYVSAGTSTNLNIYNSPLTLEAWVKATYTPSYQDAIIQRMQNAMDSSGYSLEINDDGTLSSYYYYGGSGPTLTSNRAINDGQWHHIVATFNSTNHAIYIDGQLDVQSSGGYPTSPPSSSLSLNIGKFSEAPDGYFKGVIDTARVYSRALSPNEIQSNYQSGNIEMRYRTSSDGSTWSDWSNPETSVEDFENEYLYDTSDTGLIAYYPMEETAGGTVFDVAGSNNGTSTGTTWVDGKNGGGKKFNGTSDYISIPSSSMPSGGQITISFWAYGDSQTLPLNTNLFEADDTSGNRTCNIHLPWGSGIVYWDCGSDGGTTYDRIEKQASASDYAGRWTYWAFTKNATEGTLKIYMDGKLWHSGTGLTKQITPGGSTNIGSKSGVAGNYWPGMLDEFQIYNRALTDSEINALWLEGTSDTNGLQTNSTPNFIEGQRSLEIDSTGPSIDANTVGYWKLDESTGTGAYILDSSPNGNDGTPTGTTYVKDGKVGGARSFNGTSDNIGMGDVLDMNGQSFTVEAWVKPVPNSSYGHPVRKGDAYFLVRKSDGRYEFGSFNGTCQAFVTGTKIYNSGAWDHIVGVYDQTYLHIYVNGILESKTPSSCGTEGNSSSLNIGSLSGSSNFFSGEIDEVRISNIARTSEEIYQSYILGKEKYVSKSIDTNDISNHSMLPFWIASDELGNNIDLIYGNSEYANYEPDVNTVGLWRLDEGLNTDDPQGLVDNLWEAGQTGSIGSFSQNGTETENYRIKATDPWGGENVVWEARPDSVSDADGGWNHSISSIDNSKMYRFSVWVNRKVTGNGNFYLGTHGYGSTDGVYRRDSGTNDTNPYFWVGTPSQDTWTLVVGHVWPSGSGTGSVHTDSGQYTVSGGKVASISRDFVWRAETTSSQHRSYLYYSTDTSTRQQWIYPRLDIVDGTEPSISELLNGYDHWSPVTDSSGSNNHGTAIGTSKTDGRIGSARSFNGVSEYISIPNRMGFDSQADFPITIEAWVKPYSFSSHNGVVHIGYNSTSGNSNGVSFSINTPGNVYLEYGDGTGTGSEDRRSSSTPGGIVKINEWSHVVGIIRGAQDMELYVNGVLKPVSYSGTGGDVSYSNDTSIGISNVFNAANDMNYFDGLIDEVRVSQIARTPNEIRQSYEVGRRTHSINVDFKADLESSNLIDTEWDKYFTISEQDYGTSNPIENIDVGEKIVVKENIGGIEYIAQGNLASLVTSTGSVEVSSWDTGSTFPASGFTANATVFKWQRVYIDVRYPLDEDINALTRLTFRKNTDVPAKFWIDDVKKATYSSDYNASAFSTIEGVKYLQYQPIFTKWDDNPNLDLYLTEVNIGYSSGPTNEQLMRHGKWFDSSGVEQPFWWVGGRIVEQNTVTYTRNPTAGGSLSFYSQSVVGGSSITGPTVTTNTGYTFDNFTITSGSCGGTFNSSTGSCSSVTGDMTIQANWTLDSYTVTYTRNPTAGGSLSFYSQAVNHGSSVTGPTVSTNTGYTFDNFTITSGSCDGTFTSSTGSCSNVTGAMTIQANWTIDSYTVTYDGNGGTCTPSSRTVDYGSSADGPSCSRSGYIVSSFSITSGSCAGTFSTSTGSCSNVQSNMTIAPSWVTLPSYIVTVNENGGVCGWGTKAPYSQTTSVTHGNPSPAPDACYWLGYELCYYSITSGSCAGTFNTSTGTCSNVESSFTFQPNWAVQCL